MRITGVIWLEVVADKLQRKHRVTTDEAEEVLANRPRFRRLEAGDVQGEDLYAAPGRTRAGRFLIVFFVYKASAEALIVSAREMTGREKRLYGRK